MRRFRQGDAPVILYSPRGVKLFDFGVNRIIETDDEDLSNLLLAMGAIEIPPVVPPVPQDLTEVAARINALDGRVLIVEGRADIKSVGVGLSLSGAGELSATGSGGQGPPGEKGADGYSPTVAVTGITGGHRVTITDVQGPHAFEVLDGQADSVDWANVTNKPANLVQDAAYVHTDSNFTAAEKAKLSGLENYDDTALSGRVTTLEGAGYQTAQNVDDKIADALEVFDHLDYKVADSPPTPTTVVIGGQTVQTQPGVRYMVKHSTDDRYAEYILIDGAIYDIGSTGDIDLSGYATTAAMNTALAGKQDTLVSGTNIKTVNGKSLLGAGDITLANANMQTEGDWRYKINPDNTFEAYYYKSGVTLTITDQSGNFFRSALQTLALPAGIANNYAATPLHASVNAAHNNYPCFGTLASMATNQVKYYAMSGSSRGQSPNYIVTAHVFGILAANA